MTLGLAGAFALAGLSGCIFSPEKRPGGGGGPPPVVYAVPEYPQIVLNNLMQAYNNRDSVEYRKLFALDYQGSSYDTSTVTGQPFKFTWADEVRHIQKLRQDNSILNVTLNLNAPGSWIRTPATGPAGQQWAEITIFNPKLQIDTAMDSEVLVSNELFTFQFAPETPAPASSTDTLWTIVRWIEDAP